MPQINFRSIWVRFSIMAGLLFNTAAALAQEVTPEPSITVPTSQIFEQTNTWITVFLPVVAIGAGIAIALAVLKFITAQIVAAFKTGW